MNTALRPTSTIGTVSKTARRPVPGRRGRTPAANSIDNHVEDCLHHLYISPLEQCNLQCKMCYTTKTSTRLTNDQILDFVERYDRIKKIQTVTFCGGEVFILSDFVNMVNKLIDQDIFVQIITNGTIDKLEAIKKPNRINLIVSLDGLPQYHDQNRGPNKWRQSVKYLKKAGELGFHRELFSIVTRENMGSIDCFEKELKKELGESIDITYHPRKPITYLRNHPNSNQVGETNGFSFITPADRIKLAKTHRIFPGLDFGCYQISLMSDGMIYGCCEGTQAIGSISEDVHDLITKFKTRIDPHSNCIEPGFMCGLQPSCQKREICL